jgi:thiol-disulfide isomerase/thioredoxin
MVRRSEAGSICFALALFASLLLRADDIVLFKNPKPAPELRVTALNGHDLDLSAFHGKVVLLNFWATWCGPCRMEIPELVELQRKYPEQVQVIGMSIDEIEPAEVQQFARQLGVNYPVAMASEAIQQRFGRITSVPTTFVIDPQGEIVQKHRGLNPTSVFDSEVRALLNLPFNGHVSRIDQMAPNGKVGTTEIPGLVETFKHLTRAQKQQALERLNSESCNCGCDLSLANCRVEDPGCGYSLPAAKKVLAQIAAPKLTH